MKKYMYVVDYWVPFPSSEYGGLITLIAENDAEALELLSDEESFHEDYGHLIMETHELLIREQITLVITGHMIKANKLVTMLSQALLVIDKIYNINN